MDERVFSASEIEVRLQAEAALRDFIIRSRATLLPKGSRDRTPKWTTSKYETERSKLFHRRDPELEPLPDMVESPPPPEMCSCADATTVDEYKIPDPFQEDGTLTITRVSDGACDWCGWSNGADDERQKYELTINSDIDGHGTCGWALAIHDGDVLLSKAWDDGNPAGTYTSLDEGSTTVEEGEGTVNNPC